MPIPLFVVDVLAKLYRETDNYGVIANNYKGIVSTEIFKEMNKKTFIKECEKAYDRITNSKDGEIEIFIEETYTSKEK